MDAVIRQIVGTRLVFILAFSRNSFWALDSCGRAARVTVGHLSHPCHIAVSHAVMGVPLARLEVLLAVISVHHQ
jgi:hypothetical protein